MIKVLTIKSTDSIQFGITEVGGKLVVSKGSFEHDGKTEELADDFECSLASADVARDVDGYLVKHKKSGEFAVLVDEVLADGADVPFDFSKSDYECIAGLFWAIVPPKTEGYDKVEVVVTLLEKMVKPERPVKSAATPDDAKAEG